MNKYSNINSSNSRRRRRSSTEMTFSDRIVWEILQASTRTSHGGDAYTMCNNLFAKEIGNNIKDDISDDIQEIKPDINKKTNISNSSAEDIFGDEQTFPFVAGLGKNAAH